MDDQYSPFRSRVRLEMIEKLMGFSYPSVIVRPFSILFAGCFFSTYSSTANAEIFSEEVLAYSGEESGFEDSGAHVFAGRSVEIYSFAVASVEAVSTETDYIDTNPVEVKSEVTDYVETNYTESDYVKNEHNNDEHNSDEHDGEGASSHHNDGPTIFDDLARETSFDNDLFGSDPVYPELTYDPEAQLAIYGAKSAVKTPRPLVEIGRDLYSSGSLGEGIELIGSKNKLFPQLLIYGDARSTVAFNRNRGATIGVAAAQLNLDVDLKLTATERIHAFFRPFDKNGRVSRFEFAGNSQDSSADPEFFLNPEPLTTFFEGDLGAIIAGLTDEYQPYDIPFTFGRVPLLLQNGVWLEDAFIGAAVAIPAKNSSKYDISNFDITIFTGLDEVSSDAFRNSVNGRDDHDAKMVGIAGFLEFGEGYMETGYAYVHDSDSLDGDFSYHNATVSFTKRYGGKISNSTRVIANFGQNVGDGFEKTADGILILSENSLISSKPLTFVPYANFWAGIGKTQSLARGAGAGGVLRNTGLSFETDGLTGFPTIDATAQNTFGGAIGIQNLFSLEQQIVGEIAAVIPHSNDSPVQKAQLAAGVRYQRPLNNHTIFRMDGMYGLFGESQDSLGLRMELRRKF